jgi:hypothetical protein
MFTTEQMNETKNAFFFIALKFIVVHWLTGPYPNSNHITLFPFWSTIFVLSYNIYIIQRQR